MLGRGRRIALAALGRSGIALLLTAAFTVAEVVGGLLTGSLALLADAGHMLSDSFSLAVALFAIWIATRPPTPQRSFGYQRAEVLAALFNGVALIVVAGLVIWGAIGRLSDPPEVLGGPMLAVALGGVAVNLAALRILSGSGGGMNIARRLAARDRGPRRLARRGGRGAARSSRRVGRRPTR